GTLELETAVASGNHRPFESMTLGPFSGVTCPSCHGALVTIRDGSITRYRCHTGHAFSEQTIEAAIDSEVDDRLFEAVRALEERAWLSRQWAHRALAAGDLDEGQRYAASAEVAIRRASQIKALLLAAPPTPSDADVQS
ncbi:MAG: hypothetical protein ABI652_09185, partial [Acidobacteriota bacterium]